MSMQIEEIDYGQVLALRHEVMYPEHDINFVKLDNDANGIHVGIREQGDVIAVVSIFLEGRDIQFRKLATKESFQHKGYATSLIKWILAYAKEMKLNKVWANSRVNIYPLYEQLGFAKTDKTFSKNGYDYVVVEYDIEDKLV